ncbi:MAG TPA: hydroxymethylbilane synthase [Thermomicrobiales bacterium]|jgi:hydroxymethylbilane synthase|nr:hydroxymethylbilane synthase [Thermomicrobiales bacterium]
MGSTAVVRIGARGSRLSRAQVEEVRLLLLGAWPGITVEVEIFVTTGDIQLETPLPLMGGKGVFTSEIETALREGRIDFAVHSLKDLPVANPDGIVIGAVPERASVADVLVSRSGRGFHELSPNPVIGTSSYRRAAQLQSARSDSRTESIRGNVETRLRKAMDPDGPYDAIVLAKAGLERLGLLDVITEELPLDLMLPAPGQAALAVQCRDDADSIVLAAALDHLPTRLAVEAERAFLSGLGGGCSAPVASYGELHNGQLTLRGRVLALDGQHVIDVQSGTGCGDVDSAQEAGRSLAATALQQGAGVLVEVAR